MVGWAMDRVEEKCRCFNVARPMPAAKDTSKAVGASQGQGRLGCGMADMVGVDVGIGQLEGEMISWRVRCDLAEER